jgi:hypothetical protein
MTAKAEQAVLDIVERDWMKDGEPKFSQIPFEDRAQPAWAPRVVGIRAALDPIIEELTGQLNAVLAGEDIEVRDVQLRLATPDKPERQGIHVDLGGYMTATYALRGRGTILYRTLPDGRVQAMEAPTHSWAIINNLEREAATDIPGTVHDTPITDRPRVLLIIRFVRRGQKIADDERKVYQERGRKRAAAVTTALANQGLKPAPPKKGILSKLFGE